MNKMSHSFERRVASLRLRIEDLSSLRKTVALPADRDIDERQWYVVESELKDNVKINFPPPWCLPPTCVKLYGKRRSFQPVGANDRQLVKRLFIADLVWLFYFDRMGIFKILGAILDDYAIKGKLPISNIPTTSQATESKNDLIVIVLEAMTRKTKMGFRQPSATAIFLIGAVSAGFRTKAEN